MSCPRRLEGIFGCLVLVVIEVVNFCGLVVLGGCSFCCSSASISGVDFELSKLGSEVKYLRREV